VEDEMSEILKQYDVNTLIETYLQRLKDPVFKAKIEAEQAEIKKKQEKIEFLKSNSYKLELPDWYELNNSKVVTQLKQALININEQKSFALFGSVGSGKTLLAELIAEAVLPKHYRKDVSYEFVDAPEIWERAKDAYSRKERVRAYDMLSRNFILDDLGSEEDTPASRAFFTSLLLEIYNRWRGGGFRLLIITSNLGLNEIQNRYTERIRSRFDEMFTLFMLQKRDFRSEKRRGWSDNK